MTSTNLGTIYYTIDARTGQLVADLNRADNSLDNTRRTAGALRTSMSALAGAIAGVISIQALSSARKLGESYNILRAQIARLSESTDHAAATYQKLVSVSSETGATLKVTVGLWQGLTGSLKESGATNTDILRLVETIQKIGSVGGSSAEEMSNALRQFGQSMAGGIVRGEEFNSVIENMPELARQMAKGMGIPFSQLRTQMLEGKLTAAAVQKALVKQQEEVDKAFAAMPRTVANAANAITTEFGAALADLDNFYGVSVGIAGGFDSIANSIKGISTEDIVGALDKAAVAAELFAAVLIGRVSMAAAGYIRQQYLTVTATLARIETDNIAAAGALRKAQAEQASALIAIRVAQAEFTAAEGTAAHTFALTALNLAQDRYAAAAVATAAAQNVVNAAVTRGTVAFGALRSVMMFLGGPLGVVLLAATAIYAFSSSTDTAKKSVDELNASLDKLTFNQLAKEAKDLAPEIKTLERTVEAFQKKLNNPTAQSFQTSEGFANQQIEDKNALDTVNQELQKKRDLMAAIVKQQDKITVSTGLDPVKALSPAELDAAKSIENLKKQEALLKVVGVARAKLAATQKLEVGADPTQIAQVEALAESIYNLEEAQKSQKAAEKKGLSESEKLRNKSNAEEKKQNEDLLKLYEEYGVEIANVGKTTRDLAMDTAELKAVQAKPGVTQEQIKSLRDLAAAQYDLNAVQSNKQLVGQFDPVVAENTDFGKKAADLEIANKVYVDGQKLLSEEAYLAAKTQMETEHAATLTALDEQRFAAQSKGNAMIISTLNQVQSAATSAFTGLITGASNGTEAVQALAGAILNEAVGAVVAFGFAQLKSLIIGQTVGTAATAMAVGQAGIAATAWATPAALASLATLGGNAVPAGAALTGTVGIAQGLALGARQYGGPVSAGGMYRVNETGAPEIFNAANGRQYMMPNQSGDVVSNKDASSGGGGSSAPIVNVNNYSGQQATASSKFSEADRTWVVDVIVGDMQGGGKTAQTTNQITGTQRAGR